jgi:hypothetical protein
VSEERRLLAFSKQQQIWLCCPSNRFQWQAKGLNNSTLSSFIFLVGRLSKFWQDVGTWTVGPLRRVSETFSFLGIYGIGRHTHSHTVPTETAQILHTLEVDPIWSINNVWEWQTMPKCMVITILYYIIYYIILITFYYCLFISLFNTSSQLSPYLLSK